MVDQLHSRWSFSDFSVQIAQKSFNQKSKLAQTMQVAAWLSDLLFHLQPFWENLLRQTVDSIHCKACPRLFPSFCAQSWCEDVQLESEPLQDIWQSFPKAIPEDNRFWLQSPWLSFWDSAQAQIGRVGQANINAGRTRVDCSCCWQPSLLQDKVIPTLRYCLGSWVQKILKIC